MHVYGALSFSPPPHCLIISPHGAAGPLQNRTTCTCFFSGTSILPTCFYYSRCSFQKQEQGPSRQPFRKPRQRRMRFLFSAQCHYKSQWEGIFSSPGLKSSRTIEPRITVRMKVPLVVLILSGKSKIDFCVKMHVWQKSDFFSIHI